jgi:hypothetical protein
MSVVSDWVLAYARQADADFRAWELYQRNPQAIAAECHRLLFLQMACEKLCKAYLLKYAVFAPSEVQSSHAFVRKHLPTILREGLSISSKRRAARRAVVTHLRHFAKEVEILNPMCDAADRPDNCEYPWQVGDKILSPLDWSFIPSNLLTAPAGVTFLKAIRVAINRILDECRESA